MIVFCTFVIPTTFNNITIIQKYKNHWKMNLVYICHTEYKLNYYIQTYTQQTNHLHQERDYCNPVQKILHQEMGNYIMNLNNYLIERITYLTKVRVYNFQQIDFRTTKTKQFHLFSQTVSSNFKIHWLWHWRPSTLINRRVSRILDLFSSRPMIASHWHPTCLVNLQSGIHIKTFRTNFKFIPVKALVVIIA